MIKKLLTVMLVVCMAATALADEFDAMFGEMEEMKVEPPKEKSTMDKIIDGTNLSLTFRYYRFLHGLEEPEEDKDTRMDYFNAYLELETRYIQNPNNYYFKGWFEEGNEHDTYRGGPHDPQDEDRFRRIFQIGEAYMIHTQGDHEFTLGKREIDISVSTLYSPSERLTVIEGNDPLHPKEIGIWQARYDYYTGQNTYSFYFVPFFNESRFPSPVTRWSGEKDGDEESSEFDDVKESDIDEESTPVKPKNFSYMARAKTVWKGYDLFIAGFYGVSPYSVLAQRDKNKEEYESEHPLVWAAMGGFSTTWQKFEFHGEAYSSVAAKNKDDDFVNFVLGTTYTLDRYVDKLKMQRAVFTVEYAGESVFDRQSNDDYVHDSSDQRSGKNDIIGRATLDFSDDFSIVYLGSRSFEDEGVMQSIGIDWNVRNDVLLKSYFEFFDGPSDSYYGRWRNNDRWYNTVTYSF